MAELSTRELKDLAAQAASKGKWGRALECYLLVEKAEPGEGLWPHKAGEIHRRLGNKPESIEALSRAAGVYSKGGFLLKAIAVCKLILEQDPNHSSTQAQLAALHSRRAPTKPQLTAAVLSLAPPRPAPKPLTGAASDELSLSSLVPGARKWSEAASSAPAVFEIPIEIEQPAAEVPDSLRALLPRTPLFSALEERHLCKLIERVRLVRLEGEEILFHQGDAADALYVVASGSLAVLIRAEGKSELVEVSRLGEGSFLGEIALLAEQPRSATVRAAMPTELLAIDREVMRELVRDAPDVLGVLLRFVRDRLLNSMVESNRLFTPLSPRERLSLSARLRFLEVEPGAMLVEQGKSSTGFFILLAGNLATSMADGKSAPLKPGDIFGEQSLLDHLPATSSIRALTKSFLLGLNPTELAEVVSSNPKVLDSIRALSTERQARLQSGAPLS